MRPALWLFLFSLFFCAACANSQTFVGTGIDKSEIKAKQLAFTDLQQNMYVTVESQSQLALASDRPNYYRLTSKLSASLPILGANAECVAIMAEFQCQVSLDNANQALYRAAILDGITDIEQRWRNLADARGDKKFNDLNRINQKFEQLKPLGTVYRLLAPTAELPTGQLKLTPAKIQAELHRLQSSPDSIEMLAVSIAEQYQGKQRIFVKPITIENSMEITPFAKALRSQLLKHLDAIDDKDYAFYLLGGNYSINKAQLQVQTSLTTLTRDQRGSIAGATSHLIATQHLEKFAYAPTQLDFDQLLRSGQILSQDLSVKLQTNKGSRDLLFAESETIKLLVKVNRPAYYYLLGHSSTESKRFSYLLDLQEGTGPERFIYYLGHDEVNRWITIGEFEVHPPFGIETLQAFASLDNPVKQLPQTNFDGLYHRVAESPVQAVNKTRGLVRKRQTNQASEVRTAETVLRFTTSAKE